MVSNSIYFCAIDKISFLYGWTQLIRMPHFLYPHICPQISKLTTSLSHYNSNRPRCMSSLCKAGLGHLWSTQRPAWYSPSGFWRPVVVLVPLPPAMSKCSLLPSASACVVVLTRLRWTSHHFLCDWGPWMFSSLLPCVYFWRTVCFVCMLTGW